MKRAIIIGSAPGATLDYLPQYRKAGDLILCADGGLLLAQRYGLVPDWYVGDSDSGGETPADIPNWTLPSEKDVTDLEMAVEVACNQGCKQLLLCGCTGGRGDHHLANLYLLERLAEQGISALLLDDDNEISALLPGMYTITDQPHMHYFSVLPLDRCLKDLTITGAKYLLDRCDVPRGSTLTVSNEPLPGQQVTISFTAGNALFIRSIRE